MNDDWYRSLSVPADTRGIRLDRFLAAWFPKRSRSWLARNIKDGKVTDAQGRPLRASTLLRGGEDLRLFLPGIAPGGPPPPFPRILHEDARVVVVDKPAGMPCHPAGEDFVYALVGLARDQWPGERIDLVHRLDRGTSGCIVLTRDLQANAFLKDAMKRGEASKRYVAIAKGEIPWEHRHLRGPIGAATGPIRIQMAVREDGLAAHTEVQVLNRQPGLSRVACTLHTGRTHQIRVHLSHAGFPLLGDVMYGIAPEVFLHTLDHGIDASVRERSGAPRHALHAAHIELPHPDGGLLTVDCEVPADMGRWWRDPSVLPHDGAS